MPAPTPPSTTGLTTNLGPLTGKATAAQSLASLALAIPISSQPGATKGYQPIGNLPSTSAVSGDSSLLNLASSAISSLLSFTSLPTPLIFHYEGENTGTFESDITDHYVEDNTTIVDQVGIRPEQITVSGFIGELNNVLPAALQALQTIANNLLVVDAYQPQVGITAQQQLNQATLLYESANSIANSAVAAWGSIATAFGAGSEVVTNSGTFTVGSSIVQDLQQTMFQQFYGYWYNRTLFNIQTPWAIFTNMVIKTLRPVQDAETRMITNFEVTFKKIRTAQSLVTGPSSLISVGRANTQSADSVQNGITSGVPGSDLGSSLTAVA